MLGLFALGLATIIRHTAGSITTFVAILLILPLVDLGLPGQDRVAHRPLPARHDRLGHDEHDVCWARTPTSSRRSRSGTASRSMCAYAVGALVIGGVLMVRRDP